MAFTYFGASAKGLGKLLLVALAVLNVTSPVVADFSAIPTWVTASNVSIYSTPVTIPINATNATEAASTVTASTRIIGGVTVDASDREWMVALNMYNSSSSTATLCGGSYIGSSSGYHFVVTAAHCVVYHFDIAKAYFNTDNAQTLTSDSYSLSSFSTKFVNANYDASAYTNDIGILVFTDSSFTAPTPAILGSSKIDLVTGETVTVTGYGLTSYRTQSDDYELRAVNLSLISDSSCSSTFSRVNVETDMDVEICAEASDKGSCSGDSGGPLIAYRGDEEVVIGLVSWGVECADTASYPDVYTRVTYFEDWIDTQVASLTGNSSFLRFYNQSSSYAPSPASSLTKSIFLPALATLLVSIIALV